MFFFREISTNTISTVKSRNSSKTAKRRDNQDPSKDTNNKPPTPKQLPASSVSTTTKPANTIQPTSTVVQHPPTSATQATNPESNPVLQTRNAADSKTRRNDDALTPGTTAKPELLEMEPSEPTTVELDDESSKKTHQNVLKKRKRTRRGRWKGKGGCVQKYDNFSIMHVNLNGFDSKQVMLNQIVNEKRPTVLNLNELLFLGSRKLQIPNYRCFNVNRTNGKGGGVGTCYANDVAGNVLKIKEGIKTEMLVTRLDNFLTPINIINIYGSKNLEHVKKILSQTGVKCLKFLQKYQLSQRWP